MDMPKYRSHKVVGALEIAHAERLTCRVSFVDHPDTIIVGAEMFVRYQPTQGDFLVEYEGGYQSFSPRAAFLDGYLPAIAPQPVAAPSVEAPGTHTDDEHIARVCHEVNRAYCASIGDNSQPAWADAPEWQRESAINGVKFTIANPDALPSASHDSWSAEKVAAGWVYGPVKDPEAKQHPCLVPYDELPVEQRTKDYLFQAVVRSLT